MAEVLTTAALPVLEALLRARLGRDPEVPPRRSTRAGCERAIHDSAAHYRFFIDRG